MPSHERVVARWMNAALADARHQFQSMRYVLARLKYFCMSV
ncbi:hypothetical protein APY04_0104 [Hyphomicrobium sulfonivorans]|uniref:Uncharacterized protein n=1 Tax=Hyphomicrobium sulfonivorans TaxID=121290 RepID=A0A109BP73_HYPSL|nr:hypothetical protein APY04_0104 [Hyphomicrobium sulfonivorans]